MAVKIKAVNPSMRSGEKNFVSSQITTIFIAALKKPRVKIMKGREINFKSGFIIQFMNDNMIPQIRKFFQPEILTPGMKYAAKYIAKELAKIRKIKLI